MTADGIRFDYMDTPSQLIQLEDKDYAAYSLVCTHLGCIVKWEAAKKDFHCPCHAGKFDENGLHDSRPAAEAVDQVQGRGRGY